MPGFPVHQPESLLKLRSVESVMPSNHLILCSPLLLLPSIFPSIRVFFPVSWLFFITGKKLNWKTELCYVATLHCLIGKTYSFRHGFTGDSCLPKQVPAPYHLAETDQTDTRSLQAGTSNQVKPTHGARGRVS